MKGEDGQAGLSARIAAHVATTDAAALPATALHAAKRALLDGLGVMLAASGMSPEITPFVDLARAAGEGPATVLGHGFAVPAASAALANGAMAHALDFEDAFDAAPSHPNASLLPAALAMVQARGIEDGRALLAAIAIGCDLVCRIGLSLRQRLEDGGWYPPPILGAFGAAAAASRLAGLNACQVRDCFSLLLFQTTTPGEIKYSRDTVLRAVREAFPAQAAIQSVELAQRGIAGFDAPFEGRAGFFRLYAGGAFDAATIEDRLGSRYWIEELSFKRWPACRGTHAYIEAVQAMRAAAPFDPAHITEIVAGGGDIQRMLAEPIERKRAPTVTIDAKFSIPFTIAAALRDDEVTLDSFTAAHLADPATRALAALVRYEVRQVDGDAAAAGTLELRFADGTTRSHAIAMPAGHPKTPLTDAALREKFIDCAGRARRPIAPVAAGAIADTIAQLETPGALARLLAALN